MVLAGRDRRTAGLVVRRRQRRAQPQLSGDSRQFLWRGGWRRLALSGLLPRASAFPSPARELLVSIFDGGGGAAFRGDAARAYQESEGMDGTADLFFGLGALQDFPHGALTIARRPAWLEDGLVSGNGLLPRFEKRHARPRKFRWRPASRGPWSSPPFPGIKNSSRGTEGPRDRRCSYIPHSVILEASRRLVILRSIFRKGAAGTSRPLPRFRHGADESALWREGNSLKRGIIYMSR
jgi:hypothetical protein